MDSEVAYAELGLSPGASETEVKAAWRRLVSRWHPDRNPTGHAVERMQRINRAYEHISRWHADALDSAASPQDQPSPAAGPSRTTRRRLRLTLEEAALGCVKSIRGRLTHRCAPCDGHGRHVLEGTCPACDGAGKLMRSRWFGWLPLSEPCDACGGDGLAWRACTHCAGSGRRTVAYRRNVRIPPGVRHGDVLSAEGAEDDDAGMLELCIEIVPHKLFALGDDGILRCEMPVDGFAWAASRWIDVPTLNGLTQMRLQHGRHAYRLRGQGFPVARRGEPGDYIVTVVPTFPPALNAAQEALLDRLIAAGADTGPVRAWTRKVQAWERGRVASRAERG